MQPHQPAPQMQPYQPHPKVKESAGRQADLVVSIVLTMLYGTAMGLIWFLSLFLSAFATDSCGAQTCRYEYLAWALGITDIGGGVVLLAVLIAVAVRLGRRRTAWWIPLVGIGIQVILMAISLQLIEQIPG
ncbi:hypothetical protein [Williamsia sp. CHRR-6]|uniref:hypothetical protein n=1 Tax=Williamsia sp. CHRR-6 TaxID=2835871 RepID=UPI001BD91FDE|nr:hypothetical protein [Williamsia sp. CHRR-6]MBT0568544.1 hypothetical protein [Williamsia sp. CHRR-6]